MDIVEILQDIREKLEDIAEKTDGLVKYALPINVGSAITHLGIQYAHAHDIAKNIGELVLNQSSDGLYIASSLANQMISTDWTGLGISIGVVLCLPKEKRLAYGFLYTVAAVALEDLRWGYVGKILWDMGTAPGIQQVVDQAMYVLHNLF